MPFIFIDIHGWERVVKTIQGNIHRADLWYFRNLVMFKHNSFIEEQDDCFTVTVYMKPEVTLEEYITEIRKIVTVHIVNVSREE